MNAKRTICVTAALLVVCAFSSHTPEETNAVARAMLERAAFGWNDDLTDGGPWMGGARVFAGCGPATVVAGEINHAGGNAFMCASSFFTASSGFGATDFTHPVPAGADAFARLFVAEVKARRLKVSGLFRENCDIQISGHRNCVAKKYLL